MKKVKKNKYIPTKNYILTILLIIGIIFLVLYITKWHEVKDNQDLTEHYLISSNTISLYIDEYNEIDSILTEAPSYFFILLGDTNNKDVYNLEKDIQSTIEKYDLENNFYLFDITNMKKEETNYLDKINNKFDLTGKKKITKIPTILYFENNKFINSVDNKEDLNNLIKLFKINQISQ
ncbi:MAG: hypothetical protein IJ574_01685 [Bacilli bacterium]|nr:hypothetical protein [Bacilli bacterium]